MPKTMDLENFALISECTRYRYLLGRSCAPQNTARVLWIMLNPSTADGSKDDPTLRRCIAFTQRFGIGTLEVCNLFALRATNPAELVLASDPVGPENDRHLAAALSRCDLVVCAWGNGGGARRLVAHRAPDVMRIIRRSQHRPHALGYTNGGHPSHPLYLPADSELLLMTE